MDFLDFSLVKEGGPMMWPLLFLSVVGFLFFVERTLYLHKGQIHTREFISGIKNLLRKRRLLEALTVCQETPGPIGNVVKAALLNHDKEQVQMRGAVQAAALVEIPNLERRVGTLSAIGFIAPFIGLLGTVLGMMETFFALEAEGYYAHLGNFSGGMRQALITTGTGLGIAIMAYTAHHFLTGRVRAVAHDMEWVANEIIQFLISDMPDEDEGDAEELTKESR